MERLLLNRILVRKSFSFLFYNGASRNFDTIRNSYGQIIQATWSSEGWLKSLASPDQTPDDNSDNLCRTYLYEDSRSTSYLIGITDARGNPSLTLLMP